MDINILVWIGVALVFTWCVSCFIVCKQLVHARKQRDSYYKDWLYEKKNADALREEVKRLKSKQGITDYSDFDETK